MRGVDHQQSQMFSYLSPETRVRKDHPLRAIRLMVDEVLAQLSGRFDSMYASAARPSIPPAKLGKIGGQKNRRFRIAPDQLANPPKNANDLKALLATAICQIHAGLLDPKVGAVLASVGNILLKTIETTDLEERIHALERSAEAAKDSPASSSLRPSLALR